MHTHTDTPTLPGTEPNPIGELGNSYPDFAPAGLPPLHPLNREGNQPGSEAMLDRRGAERGGEMEGKEDSVKHSVSQSGRAVGGRELDAVPGGGKVHSCHAKCGGRRNRGPSRLRSEGGDVTSSLAASMGQPPDWYELAI